MQQKWWPRKSKSRFETLSLLLRGLQTLQMLFSLLIPRVYQVFSGHVGCNVYFHIARYLIAKAVLLILDRNIDLTSVISHGWTYQALLSDCFSMKLNRVIVSEGQKNQRYDLDNKDFFWGRNSASPFPQVAEEIELELNKYKQDAAEITRSTGVSDVDDISKLWVRMHPCIRFSLIKSLSETFLPTPPTSKLLSHNYQSWPQGKRHLIPMCILPLHCLNKSRNVVWMSYLAPKKLFRNKWASFVSWVQSTTDTVYSIKRRLPQSSNFFAQAVRTVILHLRINYASLLSFIYQRQTMSSARMTSLNLRKSSNLLVLISLHLNMFDEQGKFRAWCQASSEPTQGHPPLISGV